MQDLSYTYDPAGNITQIADDAQQTIYFNNQVVTPDADYTYDAIYRLIEAQGREHHGPDGVSLFLDSYNDVPRVGLAASQRRQRDGRLHRALRLRRRRQLS